MRFAEADYEIRKILFKYLNTKPTAIEILGFTNLIRLTLKEVETVVRDSFMTANTNLQDADIPRSD